MNTTRRRKFGIAALAIMLAISIAANIALYPAASRPIASERDRHLVERTITQHSAAGAREDELRHYFFPIVVHLANQDCVELRSRHDRGHVGACYDRRTGAVVEETASVSDGGRSLREAIEEWTISLIGWP